MGTNNQMPIPDFFDGDKADTIWPVPYGERARQALEWAEANGIEPAATDKIRTCFMPIDTQNTFCIPGLELFVAGQSGMGAVEDSVRTAKFIYRNLHRITTISPTMDTHTMMQIFHPIFWINDKGEHPIGAQTIITLGDVESGVWKINPAVASNLSVGYPDLQRYALHYVRKLSEGGKYPLMVWPYHAILGGVGHALVPLVEEAIFFHGVARSSQARIEIKGGNPLTENYSILCPEVTEDSDGNPIAQKNTRFIEALLSHDIVVITGQAKSHCVAWTINDLLGEIMAKDPELARKVYLLEDCTSPVVIPGVIDFTDQANEAFERFEAAGMHVVKSTDPIESWPEVTL